MLLANALIAMGIPHITPEIHDKSAKRLSVYRGEFSIAWVIQQRAASVQDARLDTMSSTPPNIRTPVISARGATPTPPWPLFSAAISPATAVPWSSCAVRGWPLLTVPLTVTWRAAL